MPTGLWTNREGLGLLMKTMKSPGGLGSERGSDEFLFNSLDSLSKYLNEMTRQKGLEVQANEEVAKYLQSKIASSK